LAKSLRVFLADDFEPFRRFLTTTLQKLSNAQIVGYAVDGLEAVQKVRELQPDLVLLDIGLPKLNGVEAARRISLISPQSKILFVSQESSADVVQEALSNGARGYVVKTDAGRELLMAVMAVLRDEKFVSSSLAETNPAIVTDAGTSKLPSDARVLSRRAE
jgi:DNA-binding NarL/FixJ family response regulator